MSSPVTQAVAQRDNGPQAMIAQYRGDLAQVLPAHVKPDTFVRLAQGIIRRDPNLARVAASNPGSFMAALLECARLGHEPGTPQYSLVCYGNEVTGIEGFTGKVERMYRAGAVSSVKAEVVREHDGFRYKPSTMDRPDHDIDWALEDRGPLRLVYAYAEMKDGSTSRVVVMNRAKVMEHKAVAKGTNRPDSPWNKWEESMWLKTAAHELEKWVPTSSEFLRDQARAAGEMLRTATAPAPAGPGPGLSVPAPEQPAGQAPEDYIDGEATEVPTDTGGAA